MGSRSLFEPKASLNGFTAHSQTAAAPSTIAAPPFVQAETCITFDDSSVIFDAKIFFPYFAYLTHWLDFEYGKPKKFHYTLLSFLVNNMLVIF